MKKQTVNLKKNKITYPTAVFAGVIFLGAVTAFGSSTFLGASVNYQAEVVKTSTTTLPSVPTVRHQKTPEFVRAIYMTQCVAATPSLRSKLKQLVLDTEINSIIIDIKDYSGTVSFETDNPLIPDHGGGCVAADLEAFIEELHDEDIYVIGRITVFQDPAYANARPDLSVRSKANPETPWKDRKGLSFIDVGAEEFWDYIVALSVESHDLGFDELNFDYVRYPSDGNMSDTLYVHSVGPRTEQLERFFKYLSGKLRVPDAGGHIPELSVDLFGMTTTNHDDLTIGQVIERAWPYFDYVAPMVYPSHYPSGFNGWSDPNKNVYGVVNFSMKKAVERAMATTTNIASLAYTRIGTSTPAVYRKPAYSPLTLRPWLQDFDYGGDYDIAEVRGQIQAAYDAGLNSWMLWSPSNRYTRGALEDSL